MFSPMSNKNYAEESVFLPENLLREARRQKGIADGKVPDVCLLDPDGDIVTYLLSKGLASKCPHWACYHTRLYRFVFQDREFGIIGCAVGASFAVLLAEQLFVSGCSLLISMTSAGVINTPPGGSKFILLENALRDEGVSYHYLPPDHAARLDPALLESLSRSFQNTPLSVETGSCWTTDAPYRETPTAIQWAKDRGVVAVEMEAAALYAFALARGKKVVCYAHLTNTMAREGADFEKGEENGSLDSLAVLAHTAKIIL
jgi:uridine phosphorylase